MELHDEEHDTRVTVDLDDQVLSSALGVLAELLRPEDGADLTIFLSN
ncbi:hypothetical protein ACIBBE_24555 [Streptomyces sp. NPDC051644]